MLVFRKCFGKSIEEGGGWTESRRVCPFRLLPKTLCAWVESRVIRWAKPRNQIAINLFRLCCSGESAYQSGCFPDYDENDGFSSFPVFGVDISPPGKKKTK